jgi:hypothetical protein
MPEGRGKVVVRMCNKPIFHDRFTALQRDLIQRLAEIEKHDASVCDSCGGEDCICCEIYHDRQRWVSPEELFNDDDNYYPEEDEEEDEEYY